MTDTPQPADTSSQPAEPGPAPAMIKADLLAGLVFILLGLAILYASWTMDRLEVRRILPLTAPGLVPGLLSLALTVCGVILALRALKRPAPGGWRELRGAVASRQAGRALAVMALVLAYTLVLVGWLPFWAATAIFVFTFILVFECVLVAPRRPFLSSLPWALGLAVVTAIAVTLVFERAFLVRLP